ncbi:hypothetical protein Scep_031049 [Stephania cephalantha]|uniref:NADH-quinone oxidoreductase subunit D domain-containing protein n=1 Tax=Stephania cephalantha TaxID=152367 RepID=A0AAP0E1C9_9MAGN
MSLDVMLIQKDLTLKNLIIKGILIIEPVRLSIKWDGQFIMYQAIAISLVHKSKHQTQTNRKCREKRNVYKNGLDESISRHERVIGNRDENHYDLLVPENILSPRRRREFRIRICFNSEKVNVVVKNLVFPTGNNEAIHGIMNRGKNMPVPATRKDLMRVNMGPHHPSMHGVLRLIVTLDGEDVIDCEPILEAITVNGPEQLGNIQVPKRASYIRVIMLELSRIASHLLWLGPFMADIGAQTPFFYIFRERELIYDLFEAATGVTEYQKLITRNPIFFERVEGVGVIGGEEAINWGLSGPMLRASGIQWDLRKVDNYECYDEFDWEVQWQKEGDSLARYLVRISEMAESIKIIQQALEGIPGGPYENLEVRRLDRARDSEWNDFEYRFISKKPSPTLELSKQELYVRVEAPKGELGIFLIGDQSVFPWRWKIRPPGFINLQILPQLVKRMKLADIMTILGVQQRIGPEYAGPLGILQALADGTKLLFKEDLLPSRGDIRLFTIAAAEAAIGLAIVSSIHRNRRSIRSSILFFPHRGNKVIDGITNGVGVTSKGKGPSPLFGPIVGEEGFEPPTPWFVATCSNPLSYRPHPVSTGSVPGSTPKRNLSSPQPFSGLRRCESAFLSIRTVPSEDLPYSIVTAVEFNHQVRDGLVWFLYA